MGPLLWFPIFLSISLVAFCVVTDFFLWQQKATLGSRILSAARDNICHSILSVLTWSIGINFQKFALSDCKNLMLSGFFASILDVDNFIVARSFSLKVSYKLQSSHFSSSFINYNKTCRQRRNGDCLNPNLHSFWTIPFIEQSSATGDWCAKQYVIGRTLVADIV